MSSKGTKIFVSIDQATTPVTGECLAGYWWTVHPEWGLIFWAQVHGYAKSESVSPQCNQDERTCRLLSQKLYPECEVRQIPVVFLEHAERVLRRMRTERSAS